MPIVYLGFGSNQGNREKNIKDAVQLLEDNNVRVLTMSRLIETTPMGGPPQGLFLNGVAQSFCELSAMELLTLIKSIEQKLGRVKTILNGPRPIDIDILLYEKQIVQTKELTIPHPRMRERDFVMTPLKEIAPDLAKDLLNENCPKH